MPVLRLMVPAIFHALCSIAGFAAYFYIQASMVMMLSGSLPVITAYLSMIFFSRIITKNQ